MSYPWIEHPERDRIIEDSQRLFGAKVTALKNWSADDRLDLFCHRFEGQPDRYIIPKGDKAVCIKEALNKDHYLQHILGKQRCSAELRCPRFSFGIA